MLKQEGHWRDTLKKGEIERRNGQKGGCNDIGKGIERDRQTESDNFGKREDCPGG